MLVATTTSQTLATIFWVAIAVDVIQAVLVAVYADARGYPPIPVFIATLFLWFPLPVLLLALVEDRRTRPMVSSPEQWRPPLSPEQLAQLQMRFRDEDTTLAEWQNERARRAR